MGFKLSNSSPSLLNRWQVQEICRNEVRPFGPIARELFRVPWPLCTVCGIKGVEMVVNYCSNGINIKFHSPTEFRRHKILLDFL